MQAIISDERGLLYLVLAHLVLQVVLTLIGNLIVNSLLAKGVDSLLLLLAQGVSEDHCVGPVPLLDIVLLLVVFELVHTRVFHLASGLAKYSMNVLRAFFVLDVHCRTTASNHMQLQLYLFIGNKGLRAHVLGPV